MKMSLFLRSKKTFTIENVRERVELFPVCLHYLLIHTLGELHSCSLFLDSKSPRHRAKFLCLIMIQRSLKPANSYLSSHWDGGICNAIKSQTQSLLVVPPFTENPNFHLKYWSKIDLFNRDPTIDNVQPILGSIPIDWLNSVINTINLDFLGIKDESTIMVRRMIDLAPHESKTFYALLVRYVFELEKPPSRVFLASLQHLAKRPTFISQFIEPFSNAMFLFRRCFLKYLRCTLRSWSS